MKQSRWRSKVAWSAVTALILFILKTYGLLDPLGLSENSFQELVTLVFAVLTAFAIFNDPTNKDGY